MNPKYRIGSIVEFNKDRHFDSEGNDIDYVERYTKGQRGGIIYISPTKVSTAKSIEQLMESGNAEYMYTIRVGMSEIINVPESDILNPHSLISDKVEERLRAKQATKEFKDTEGRIGGSKKEMRAYQMISLSDLTAIEEDEATAIELVKKDKVYPKVDVNKEREQGNSSGAVFLKVKLREAFGSEPPNNKDKRKVYVGYATYLTEKMVKITSVKEFESFLSLETISNGIQVILRILNPALADESQGIKEENAIKAEKIRAERLLVNDKRAEEEFNLKNQFPNMNINAILSFSPSPKYKELTNLYNELSDELNQYNKSYTTIEEKFLESLGVSSRSGTNWVTRQIFEEIFGKRFVNFIVQGSKPVKETFEKAKEYEALSVSESIMLIEEKSKFYYENLDKNQDKLDAIDKLITREQHDDFFKNDGNGGMGFSGGAFAKWGRGYFYYKDLRDVEQIEAYKTRYRSALGERISENKKKIEAVKQKYRARDNDWSWSDKKSGGSGDKSERSELKVNTYPPLHYIKRVGGIKITESDITPDSIRKKFGFKEVEFGQSLKDKEAKEHIRHFLGAMADIAEILNMSVTELNQLGGLSIAFASRGGGKASAHYEPLRKVINVTKTRGGGAIAHEYMHYLDNILPKIGRAEYTYKDWASVIEESRYSNYKNTGKVSNELVFKTIDDIFTYIYKRKFPMEYKISVSDALTQEQADELTKSIIASANEKVYIKKIIQASDKGYMIPTSFYSSTQGNVTPTDINEYFELFKGRYSQYKLLDNLSKRDIAVLGSIVKKFGYTEYEFQFETNKSRYYANSLNMGSDYWSRAWELFARAFETYIYDKLEKAGRTNNYLVGGSYFDREEGVYPFGEERKNLFLLYDAMIKAIKTEYKISDFVAWTDERTDEYIVLEGDKDETVESGVIVDSETKEVEEIITNEEEEKAVKYRKVAVRDKMQNLLALLRVQKLENGGNLKINNKISDQLLNFVN